jgi:hypothetical protein
MEVYIMGMKPKEYFDNFVLGNYNDFENHRGSIRCGFNAVIAASHMADHYFEYYKRNDQTKVRRFEGLISYIKYVSKKTGGCFNDIRSIANAYKHLYTGIKAHTSVDSAGRIEAIPVNDRNISEVTLGYLDVGEPMTVIFTRKTGEHLELLQALKRVVDFWENEFR